MKKLYPHAWLCLAVMVFSCAAGPQTRETSPVGGPASGPINGPNIETPATGSNVQESGPEAAVPDLPAVTGIPESPAKKPLASQERASPPEKPAPPPVPEYILGKGLMAVKDMTAFLLDTNPGAEAKFVEDLTLFYTEEAAIEGVNHDVAFAQMCLETGFLRYGNLVTPDMNNFCGLGAIGPGQTGENFPDPRTGVRAHIQHLKAYATDEPLKEELVDPRYFYVRYGSSPTIKGLSGTWAADRSYAEKINNILERLYSFAYSS